MFINVLPGVFKGSTNNTDRHDITAILLKVALNTIMHNTNPSKNMSGSCMENSAPLARKKTNTQ
jgi:hypothetical protein